MRIIVVQTLVLSLMNYCISINGCTNVTLLHRVQYLQNIASKLANGGAVRYDHVTPTRKNYNGSQFKTNLCLKNASLCIQLEVDCIWRTYRLHNNTTTPLVCAAHYTTLWHPHHTRTTTVTVTGTVLCNDLPRITNSATLHT